MARSSILGSRGGVASRSGLSLQSIAAVPSPAGDMVQVGNDLGQLSTRLVEEAADALAYSMGTNMERYKAQVMQDWPVKSGFSVGQFVILSAAGGTVLQVSLKNNAYYSGKIKQAGYTPENPAIRIIFNNTDALVDKTAQEVGDYLPVL